MSAPAIVSGRYLLAVVRGEKRLPPGVPFAYDLERWIFETDASGAVTCHKELDPDEEREVYDWILAGGLRR